MWIKHDEIQKKNSHYPFLDRDNKLNLMNVDFNCDNYCILIYCNHFESVIEPRDSQSRKNWNQEQTQLTCNTRSEF